MNDSISTPTGAIATIKSVICSSLAFGSLPTDSRANAAVFANTSVIRMRENASGRVLRVFFLIFSPFAKGLQALVPRYITSLLSTVCKRIPITATKRAPHDARGTLGHTVDHMDVQ